MARAGLLAEASPVIPRARGCRWRGVGDLARVGGHGLSEVTEGVYARGRAAFYGLRALLLTLAFAALIGQPRVEGLCRIDPADLGRLIGLDRALQVKTVRRRMGELAAQHCSDELLGGLARRHADASSDLLGVLYIDGHVHAYHGHGRRIQEARDADAGCRALVSPHARPTICFDRGGWSPRLFAELGAAGFGILIYRKATRRPNLTRRSPRIPGRRPRPNAYMGPGRTPSRSHLHRGRARTDLHLPPDHPPGPPRAPGPDPDHPHRPRRRAGRLPDVLPLAGRELLPLHAPPVRPRRPRRLHHDPRRPRPEGPQPCAQSRLTARSRR